MQGDAAFHQDCVQKPPVKWDIQLGLLDVPASFFKYLELQVKFNPEDPILKKSILRLVPNLFKNIENGQLGSQKHQYHDQYNIGHDTDRYWSILVSN